jgi:predicted amidohydrolase
MPGFVDLITAAETRWDAAALLLATWNARPAGTRPRRGDDAFLAMVDEVRAHFDAKPDTLEIDDVDRGQILAWTEAGADLVRVDAVGFGLSFSASAGFAQSWRERLGETTFRPAVGDVFPAADAPWPPALGGARRTPSSRSLNIDEDDHPHARVFREDMLAVEFDFGLWPALRRIGLRLDAVAAITVDEDLDALGLDAPRASAYPVRLSDEDAAAERVLEQLDAAIDAGAGIVVLPELSTTPATVERIEARLDEDEEQRLVICGSWHAPDPEDGQPANLSVGLVSGLRARMRHRKVVEFGDLYPRDPDDRRREGIAVPDTPLVRIYVADQFRFALVICKDFLDARVTRTLDRVGANVLLVPALSRTTQPFTARAHAHVSDAQAVSVVANGPRVWAGGIVEPTALVARPYEPGDVVEGVAAVAPSLLVFSVRLGMAIEL